MKSNMTRMGAHGRVVIPAAVRESLHLRQGERLMVVVEEGAIRLLTPAQAIREAQAIVRKYFRPGVSASEELIRERREEVRRENRKWAPALRRFRARRGNPA